MKRVPDSDYQAIINSQTHPHAAEAFGSGGVEITYGNYKLIIPDHLVADARAHAATMSADDKQASLPDIQRVLERNLKRFRKLSPEQRFRTASALIMWDLLRN